MRFGTRFVPVTFAAIFVVTVGPMGASSASANGYGNSGWQTLALNEGNFNDFCLRQGFEHGVSLANSADGHSPPDAYSVRCEDAGGSLHNVDVTAVCNDAYGQVLERAAGKPVPLIDRLADMGQPFDGWGCMHDVGVAGQVTTQNLRQWCGSRHLDLIYYDKARYQAYGWFCATGDRTQSEGIPMDKLCLQEFGSNTLDRTSNVNDRNAWECRYAK